jgi:hypothetical protein
MYVRRAGGVGLNDGLRGRQWNASYLLWNGKQPMHCVGRDVCLSAHTETIYANWPLGCFGYIEMACLRWSRTARLMSIPQVIHATTQWLAR